MQLRLTSSVGELLLFSHSLRFSTVARLPMLRILISFHGIFCFFLLCERSFFASPPALHPHWWLVPCPDTRIFLTVALQSFKYPSFSTSTWIARARARVRASIKARTRARARASARVKARSLFTQHYSFSMVKRSTSSLVIQLVSFRAAVTMGLFQAFLVVLRLTSWLLYLNQLPHALGDSLRYLYVLSAQQHLWRIAQLPP